MDDLAASNSFEVNCSMLATESSNDNLHRSPKRFLLALQKLKLAAAGRPVFRQISEKHIQFLMRAASSLPGGPTTQKKQSVTPGAATAPSKACIPAGPQQPTTIVSAAASVLQNCSARMIQMIIMFTNKNGQRVKGDRRKMIDNIKMKAFIGCLLHTERPTPDAATQTEAKKQKRCSLCPAKRDRQENQDLQPNV
ncbi:hypothetical protein PoB_005394400 [Plakobranchus ocellatus]|uniref:Uncharacterized protein n=1 Tax=Plakobranchus ocellatus TaxID=259542 RepID=A0AAV4C4G0_9GAST|nr:hypothetical protein PoB_005394400 [Plakobranchus ocellatus]